MDTKLKIVYEKKTIDGKEVNVGKLVCPAKIKMLTKADGVEEEGIFEAYVSVFGNADSYGEVVDKGAFADFLASNFPRYPKGVFSHNWDEPIAKTLEIREDEFGLYVKAKLILGVQRAKEVYELMKEGVLTDFSIGYCVDADYQDSADGLRHLKKISLFEYSPVLVGANGRAEIVSVKSAVKDGEGGGDGGAPAGGEGGEPAPEPQPTPEEVEEAKRKTLIDAVAKAEEGFKAAKDILEAVKAAVGTSVGSKAEGGEGGEGSPAPAPEGGDGSEKVDSGKDAKNIAKVLLKEARSIDKSVERLIIKAKSIIRE